MFNIEGKWFNVKTKQVVFPESTYQEDNHMYIKCKGLPPILMETFQNDYVQISDDNMGELKSANDLGNVNQPNIPELIDAEETGDFNFYSQSFPPQDTDSILTKTLNSSKNNLNVNKEIIKKAFNKQDYKYTFEVKSTSQYPKKIHSFLKEFTDVTDDEIIDYIVETYINPVEIKNALIKEIKRLFNIQDSEIS